MFDAYIHSSGRTYLIDISPFHEDHIEPLLWTWDELHALSSPAPASSSDFNDAKPSGDSSSLPLLRIIETETNIIPNLKRMTTALPFDLLQPQLPADGSVDPSTMEDGLDGVNPNDIEALVARMQKISAAAEAINESKDSAE